METLTIIGVDRDPLFPWRALRLICPPAPPHLCTMEKLGRKIVKGRRLLHCLIKTGATSVILELRERERERSVRGRDEVRGDLGYRTYKNKLFMGGGFITTRSSRLAAATQLWVLLFFAVVLNLLSVFCCLGRIRFYGDCFTAPTSLH